MLFLIVLCLYFRAKDLKLREFFEKQFPELKKQREDKERISRVSQRIRSDAEWEEIIDGLQEQEVISFSYVWIFKEIKDHYGYSNLVLHFHFRVFLVQCFYYNSAIIYI